MDEEDFLYGGVGEEKTRRQSVEEKPSTESSAPKSAQEIVSNPAFTALLKKIGLGQVRICQSKCLFNKLIRKSSYFLFGEAIIAS